MRTRIATWLAALITALALIATGWGQVWLHQQRTDEERSTAAMSAAMTTVGSVLSYDYRSLKAQFTSTSALLTGEAKMQYVDLQKPLLETAPGLKAIVQAKVSSAAVLGSEDGEVRVLLFVNQITSNTETTTPRVDQSRIVVTLVRRGGHWLVSTLAAV